MPRNSLYDEQRGRCPQDNIPPQFAHLAAHLSARRLQHFQLACQRGACWTPAGSSGGLARRLVWWPAGFFAGKRIAIISSRLGRRLWEHRDWFACVRRIMADLSEEYVVLVASGCTARPFIERLAQHGNKRLMTLELPSERTSLARWLAQLPLAPSTTSASCWTGYLSPELNTLESPAAAERRCDTPLADQWLIEWAHGLHVVRLRPRSRLRQALVERLERRVRPPGSMCLALGPQLVSLHDALPLAARGATVCRLPIRARPPARSPHPIGRIVPARHVAVSSTPPPGDFLYHCTREQCGPWPNESRDAYLDALLFDRPGAEHTSLAALRRIATEQRIRSSCDGIRGSYAVVCWTATEWHELERLRTFRAHRTRWDFLPYGIAIRRQWLATRGARPVVYGDEEVWQQMPAEQRPLFQCRTGTRSRIDWTHEREWRHLGDVELDDLTTHDAFLFVRTASEAEQLAPLSRWPVVYTEEH